MIKGVIFDVDGTLLDSMAIWRDVGVRFLKDLGVTPEQGLREILFRMSLEEGSAYLKERYQLSLSEEEIRAGVLAIVKRYYEEEAPLKHGVRALLDAYRHQDIPMVLATTNDRELVEAAFKRLGIWHYFSALFTGTELNTTKHEPLIYQTAADYMRTPYRETAVYEDVLHALQTAKEAGFYTVGVYDEDSKDDWEKIMDLAQAFVVF